MILWHGEQEIWIFRVELQFIDGIAVPHKMSVKGRVRRYPWERGAPPHHQPDAVHAGEAEDPDDAPAASSGQNRPAGITVPAPGSPRGQMLQSVIETSCDEVTQRRGVLLSCGVVSYTGWTELRRQKQAKIARI